MKGYIHRGVINANGLVNTSESITDPSKLKVHPSDDGHKLVNPETGNFEWWYFDVIDLKTGCILKLIAHLGTDPLRRRFYPQLAVTVRTPSISKTILRPYSLKDFAASAEHCDVKLGNDFHSFVESSDKGSIYHLSVNTGELKARLTFISKMEGWKPLGDKVNVKSKRKKGALYWVIPVPKARVVGGFSLGNEKYEFNDASGYHDHNYWEVDVNRKLYLDEVVSGWLWGRFLSRDYSIIFMETFLRKHSMRSLMIARNNKIIQSSDNLINISEDKIEKDNDIKTFYPSGITIKSIEEGNPFQMSLNAKEVIEKRDLLEGLNPFMGCLIKLFVSRPAYYGILADSAVNLADEEIKGTALYELMIFRKRGKKGFRQKTARNP